ncbi:hypothetical protein YASMINEVIRUS_1481, partial [Yasminevirus sp. GU-2018]
LHIDVDEPVRVTFLVDDNDRGQSQKSLLLSKQVSELVDTVADVGHAHRPGDEPVDSFSDPGDSQDKDSNKVVKNVEVAERKDFAEDLFDGLDDLYDNASPAGNELRKQVRDGVLGSFGEEETPAGADTADGSCSVATEVLNSAVEFAYE